MKIEPDSLAHLYLNMASGDWVNIDWANNRARGFEGDAAKRKALVMSTVRSLAEAGYLKIGSVGRADPEVAVIDFFEWPGSVDEQIDRLGQLYMPDNRDDKDWGWLSVFEITDDGRRVEESLPPLDERFFDGS